MGAARDFQRKIGRFSKEEIDRLIRMGWEDRTTFETIEQQFDISENDFIRLMRGKLSEAAFLRWRKRIQKHGHLKHETKRGFKTDRFKCTRQSTDGITKGWK